MGEIGWYVLIIVLFAGVLMLIDAGAAIFLYKKTNGKEIKEIRGITGFRRSIIALTVILILGIAVFHLLIRGAPADQEIVRNILSMLTGLVAAIAGFYFGGRFTERSPGAERPTSVRSSLTPLVQGDSKAKEKE